MTESGQDTDFMAASSGHEMLGAALIDSIWGPQAAADVNLTSTWVEHDELEQLRRSADQLVAEIARREAEVRDRRSALDMLIARYFHAISGILDEVELIEQRVARTQAELDQAATDSAAAAARDPGAHGQAFAALVDASPASGAADWLNTIVTPTAATGSGHGTGATNGNRPASDHATNVVPGVWFSAEADLDDGPDDDGVLNERGARWGAGHDDDGRRDPLLPEPRDLEPSDLRADYRRLAKLIAPDLGSIDDIDDQQRRTSLMARLTAAYKQGNAASLAMIEFEIGGADADDGHEPLGARIARLERSCAAMTARLGELESELSEIDASSMDQLRRRAAEADGDAVLADMVAEMHHQIAQLRANLDILSDRGA